MTVSLSNVVPQALPCAHCPVWVVRDNQGRWVHVNRAYACRDWAGVGIGTYAKPRT